jgi:L-threonylcarbamoyladenylate synthase
MASREDHLLEAVRVLRQGGIVGAATDTFFGILVDIRRSGVAERIARIKGYAQLRPVPVIVPSTELLEYLVEDVPNIALLMMQRYWPGPLTLVLRARKVVPARIRSTEGTIAVRIPGPSDALDILTTFGGPLTATSLNKHRLPPATTSRQAKTALGDELHLVVPGTAPGGLPSTIVDVTASPPRVLRHGAVKVEGRFLK